MPRLALLGVPAWVQGGQRRVLASTRRSALRIVLAARGRWVQRSDVQALFWPEHDAVRAARNLRQLLHAVSREEDLPVVERDGAALRCLPSTDLHAFLAACRDERHEAAVAAYEGPFLAGFDLSGAHEFEAWASFERSALHERWRTSALALTDRWIRDGRVAAALALCDRLLAADPLDESAASAGLRAARAVGDEAMVRRRFEAFRTRLVREVGVEPAPETVAWLDARASPPRDGRPVASRAVRVGGESLASAFGGPQVAGTGADFVGRDRERRAIAEAFGRDGARLVTVVAPGGMGKTRLARAAASDAVPSLAASVGFVPIDHAVDADGIVAACAATMAGGGSEDAWERLLPVLRSEPTLLVLDGAERHAGPETVDLLRRLLTHVPDLRLLVTSRVRIGHEHERTVVLGGLDRDAGVRLFRRAAGHRIGRERANGLPDDDVETIVASLGGMPLALELAAAWTDVLPPRRIAERIDADASLLRSDAAPMGRSGHDLDALLEDTWDRLGDDDRDGWAALALAPGSLDVEIAVEMLTGRWSSLRRLVDHGIARPEAGRIELHPLVARFARDEARGEERLAVARRHFVAPFATRLERFELRGSVEETHPHVGDVDAARAAYRVALEGDDVGALTALTHGLASTLDVASRRAERRQLFDEAVTLIGRSARDPDRRRALGRALAHATLRPDEAYAGHHEALAIAHELGDATTVAWTHFHLARCPPVATARVHYRSGTRTFRELGDLKGVGLVAAIFGRLLSESGLRRESRRVQGEARVAFERGGSALGVAETIENLWRLHLLELQLDEAEAAAVEAIERFASIADVGRVLLGHARRAWVDVYRPDPEQARRGVEGFVRRFGAAEPIRAAALQAVAAYRRTDLEEAARHARAWTAAPSAVGQETTVPPVKAYLILARQAVRHGRHDAAATMLRRALDAARASFWLRDRVEATLHVAAWLYDTERAAAADELVANAVRHPAYDPLMRVDAAGLPFAADLPPPFEGDGPDDVDAEPLLRAAGSHLEDG